MTELRRRRPPRHKAGGSRNGYAKGPNSTQAGRDNFSVLGIPLQQLIINGFGILVCVYIGYKHALYMRTIHENHMWFTNIKVSFGGSTGFSFLHQPSNLPISVKVENFSVDIFGNFLSRL